MKCWNKRLTLGAGLLAATGLFSAAAQAQQKQLTLCWAAWDPANALVELSKDFTAKTGVQMKYEFVPWPNFAQRMLNELNSKGKLCDLLIGDSQWIGSAATEGHYIKLNEFFDKNDIKMSDFMPATVEGYSTWPKGTKNYWALPAMGDAVAFTYRKDWFARPELQKEFKAKYGRDLAPPATWDEFKQIGQFFQGRVIDGKKVYGAALYTERGSEGITMGVTNTMYAYGMRYDNPAKPYDMKGYINSPEAVAGLKFYKELYDCCTPPGHANAYMTEDLDSYKSGQVAMQMNFIAFFPGIAKDPNVGGEKTGFFVMPKAKIAAAQLGGQGISVVKYSDKKDLALDYIKWFAQPAVQQKWWDSGGFSCHNAVLGKAGFATSTSYAPVFLDSMKIVKDFWQEPSYAQLLLAMQKRTHDYVVAGKGTPQEALDGLLKDWTEVFTEDGKIK
ncbi:ABC transporter substrate-binding protein [Rivibacter subsaxonicus]|uniref:Carbohydrate ABC transporter substrate-binding protein (CUT1 family) n=1 Tax=Rivibacter subsaxonicus TaxID=457575 RepID=A0A4Q7W199_9BURK|nr:extracellular solute-binding protein [Rivibacter subsaxonicus]RZU02299.1 carbohydrate ABC transporter substrate-binding protein (CUT1 family) [Rivibacter subsaxonicus]